MPRYLQQEQPKMISAHLLLPMPATLISRSLSLAFSGLSPRLSCSDCALRLPWLPAFSARACLPPESKSLDSSASSVMLLLLRTRGAQCARMRERLAVAAVVH